jgi:hypothetical protein
MNDTPDVTAAPGAILLRYVMNLIARCLWNNERTSNNRPVRQKDGLFGELILTLATERALVYRRIR